MRSLVLTLTAAAVAVGLSGCGKSSTQQSGQSAQATSAATPAAEPTEADKKAILASLPAPYNTADLANGQGKFALCSSCHTITAGGPNMTGPNLHGVIGEKAGMQPPSFNFSAPMKAAGFTWDAQHLDQWLADPKAMVPGTKMTFPGFKDPKDRTDVIAYLMVESGYKPQ
jgi:cytochrome c